MSTLSDDEREAARRIDETMRHLRGTADLVDNPLCGVCGAQIAAGQLMCAACIIETMPVQPPLRSNVKLRD